ncbi:hypothetical protein D3C71_1863890 [compost metagenome]
MKYKILSLVLLLCMVWVMPQGSLASNDSGFTLTLNNNQPVSGDKIQVKVSGEGLTDLYAYEVTLGFDSN